MSQRVKKNKSYLKLLIDTHTAQQKALLRTISTEQLKAISEIALNTLHGTLTLTASQKRTLSPYKKIIRLLGEKKANQRRKKLSLIKNIKALRALLKLVEPLLNKV